MINLKNKKPEVTQEDLQRAIVAETELFLRENRDRIIERAKERLKKEAARGA